MSFHGFRVGLILLGAFALVVGCLCGLRLLPASAQAPPSDAEKPVVSEVRLSKTTVKRKKGESVTISWKSSDNVGIVFLKVGFIPDHMASVPYIAFGLPGDARSFVWRNTREFPISKAAKIRIVAEDAAGNVAWAESEPFTLK